MPDRAGMTREEVDKAGIEEDRKNFHVIKLAKSS